MTKYKWIKNTKTGSIFRIRLRERNSYDSDIEFEEKEMEKKPVSRHYKNKQEAEKFRRKGDRIYQDKKGYYIRRPQSKKSFWQDFFGI